MLRPRMRTAQSLDELLPLVAVDQLHKLIVPRLDPLDFVQRQVIRRQRSIGILTIFHAKCLVLGQPFNHCFNLRSSDSNHLPARNDNSHLDSTGLIDISPI